DGKLSSGASSSTVDTRTLHAGVYGGIRAGRYSADAGAGYARHRFDTRRDIAFDTFIDRLEGDYDASTLQVFAHGGVALTDVVGGFIDVAHIRVNVDGLRERGGSAALQVDGDDDAATHASLGLRLDLPVSGSDTKITGSLAWRHRFGGNDAARTLVRFNEGEAFLVEGPRSGRNALVAQVSADWQVGTNGRLLLDYSGIGGDVRD